MEWAPTDVHSMQQLIRQLSRRQREELAEWILDTPDTASGVAETALAYGARRYMTVEEYLDQDNGLVRCEYIAGQIFAMASSLNRHEMIVANLVGQFHNQLRGTPCKAWASNSKVRLQVDREDVVYLPDVMIACGPFIEQVMNERYLTNPCVIVEVLSASTESTDRREKALNYRQLPSLEEYVLVAQRKMEVTVHRRSGNWSPEVLCAAHEVFESRAVEVNIALAEIYDGVQ